MTDNRVKKNTPTQNMFVADDELIEVQEVDEIQISSANRLDLPSAGQLGYPSEVEYRDILSKDAELLASATPSTYARTLNGVIKSLLNNCEFYESMCVHDRDYALIWLWANNYTTTKELEVTCKFCSNVDNVKVDMTKLPLNNIQENFHGQYEMVLKKTEKPIRIRLNTVKDEMLVEKYLSLPANKDARYDYLMLVASIDLGIEVPFENKIKWVGENVTSREIEILKKFHAKFAFGVKTMIPHTCSNTECSEVTHFDLPFQTEDILFPAVSDDFEDFLRPV